MSDGKLHHRALQRVGRQRALHRCLHGCDRKSCIRQRIQHGKALLLVPARHAHDIRHHQLARGQGQHLAFRKGLQVERKPRRGTVVIRQHAYRTAGIQSERRREVRLMDGGQADREQRRFPLLHSSF